MARFGAFAGAFGITRLANVTGLDYLGIPVFQAIRPNARSLSVSQGKGLDEASAVASAFMEAAELAHAEEAARPTRVDTYAGLKRRARAVDPSRLPQAKGASLSNDTAIRWIEGMDLAERAPVFVPFDLVHTRFDPPTRKARPLFFRSSNGLASGNHWLEAVCAGICEVIERDATSLWRHWSPEQKSARRLALDTVRNRDCRALLTCLADRDMAVAVWDITTDVGVATFLCRIREARTNRRRPLGAFWGGGCHLARDVALARAITEAAQSRLTYITGSRDDLTRATYARTETRAPFADLADDWEHARARRDFQDVASDAGPTFEHDVAQLVARLRGAGLDQVIAVDLTDDRFAIPVVRMIVPGLEPHDEQLRYKPGRRARALARTQP